MTRFFDADPPVKPPDPADTMDRVLTTFQSRLVLLGAFFTAIAGFLGVVAKIMATTALAGFVQSPGKAAEAGAIQSTEQQLKCLISQATWRGNRFIVIVDDIERYLDVSRGEVLFAKGVLLVEGDAEE